MGMKVRLNDLCGCVGAPVAFCGVFIAIFPSFLKKKIISNKKFLGEIFLNNHCQTNEKKQVDELFIHSFMYFPFYVFPRYFLRVLSIIRPSNYQEHRMSVEHREFKLKRLIKDVEFHSYTLVVLSLFLRNFIIIKKMLEISFNLIFFNFKKFCVLLERTYVTDQICFRKPVVYTVSISY